MKTTYPSGTGVSPHVHPENYEHIITIYSGKVWVRQGGFTKEYTAPAEITHKKNVSLSLVALENSEIDLGHSMQKEEK